MRVVRLFANAALLTVLACVGCGDEATAPLEHRDPQVYAWGYAASNSPYGVGVGRYWVGDAVHTIPDCRTPAASIVVHDGDVYVAGTTWVAPHGDRDRAAYWRNGERVLLDSKALSAANALVVRNGSVYVAGYDREHLETPARACVWIDGKKSYLSNVHSVATCLAVEGNDVYVGGSEESRACFWKNGVKTGVSERFSEVRSIAIARGSVYAGGNDRRPVSDVVVEFGWWWHDGVKHELGDAPSALRGLFVDRTDLHIVGGIGGNPAHWINGRTKNLTAPSRLVDVTSVYVLDKRAFIGGSYWDSEHATWRACFWRDGERTDLPFEDRSTRVSSIVVTRP